MPKLREYEEEELVDICTKALAIRHNIEKLAVELNINVAEQLDNTIVSTILTKDLYSLVVGFEVIYNRLVETGSIKSSTTLPNIVKH